MSTLGNLTVTLEANIAEFNRNMSEASRRSEESMRRIDAAAGIAKAGMVALAAVAAVGTLAMLVKNAADAADSLRDMSQMTGISVEDLNGLGFAAGQAGGSLESMVAAAGKLNKAITESADGTGKSAVAFDALGISVKDAEGNLKKADVVMAEVADQFAKYEDGPEKAALAVQLFGKAGADMIPLLNEGGDSMRENIAYAKQYSGQTTELSNAADEFNDTMGKLNVQQKSFSNALASAVLPIVNKVSNEILGAAESSNKFKGASDAVRTVLEYLVTVGANVAFTFSEIGRQIGATAAKALLLAKLDIDGYNALSKMVKEDGVRANAEHEKFIKNIKDRTPQIEVEVAKEKKRAAPRLVGDAKTKAVKGGKSEADKAKEEGDKLVATLKAQGESYGLAGAALLEYQLRSKAFTQDIKDQAIAHQLNIDGMRAEEAAEKKGAAELKKFVADELALKKQNEASVEQIRQSMMTDLQIEKQVHADRLASLEAYNDGTLERTIIANQLLEEENARHEEALASMRAAHNMNMLGMMGNSADQLYGLMKQAGMEQSALGKAVFLASKAIAVAEIIMNTEVAAAKAQAQFGAFGTPIAMAIRVAGYASAGLVAGMAVAEASAEGGYDIPSGKNPVTQLHEREMVLPKAQADVIRGLAMNGGSGGKVSYTIVNQTQGRVDSVREQIISPTERALIIMQAKEAFAADLSDPNSKPSRSMSRNFNVPRMR